VKNTQRGSGRAVGDTDRVLVSLGVAEGERVLEVLGAEVVGRGVGSSADEPEPCSHPVARRTASMTSQVRIRSGYDAVRTVDGARFGQVKAPGRRQNCAPCALLTGALVSGGKLSRGDSIGALLRSYGGVGACLHHRGRLVGEDRPMPALSVLTASLCGNTRSMWEVSG